MINNGNTITSFNDFKPIPTLTYKILSYLLSDNSDDCNNFWKALYYPTIDALSQPDLSLSDKKSIIWKGEANENDFKIFLKPLIGTSLPTANSQIQLRMYKIDTYPTNKTEAVICYRIDVLANEMCAPITYESVLCERTDVIESLLLSLINGKDIGLGYGYFQFNREINRESTSGMGINNSKNIYGRSFTMVLNYTNPSTDGYCV